jgi:1-acyl-sn-glycerol-3-phosphate acyltransferase
LLRRRIGIRTGKHGEVTSRIFRSVIVVAVVFMPASAFVAWLIILASFVSSGASAHRLLVAWARLVSRILGISASVNGLEKIVPGTSYIITSNHQSILDFLPLISVLPLRFRWVLKKGVADIPFFGWSLTRIGAISVDRSSRLRAVRNILDAARTAKKGWSILIFPEGTISSDSALLPFKRGAFALAVRTGLPILPVGCNGSFKILPRRGRTLQPGHVKVSIGDPIRTKGLDVKDIPGLMERARAEIAGLVDPNYDPFDKRSESTDGFAEA